LSVIISIDVRFDEVDKMESNNTVKQLIYLRPIFQSKKTRKTRKTCIYWRKTKIYNSKI